MLAYRRLEEAVRWSAAVQKALLQMNWPETLLQWSDCRPTKDPDTGVLLWRGLRVRMGMSWGRPSYKKPLNTGKPLPIKMQGGVPHPYKNATADWICRDISQALGHL